MVLTDTCQFTAKFKIAEHLLFIVMFGGELALPDEKYDVDQLFIFTVSKASMFVLIKFSVQHKKIQFNSNVDQKKQVSI